VSPTEEEILEALGPVAEREGADAATLLDQLRTAGRLDEVREDLAARQAIDLIAESAKPIPLAQAKAREQIWTPEKGEPEPAKDPSGSGEASRLWTPDR
jgi:trigger factor